jgi:hypothetical protein
MNWNAHQTYAPWQRCPVCWKQYREDEPGYCSAKCEDRADRDVMAAGTDARTPEPCACCCGGEGKCGYCHEAAICRAEFYGQEERP